MVGSFAGTNFGANPIVIIEANRGHLCEGKQTNISVDNLKLTAAWSNYYNHKIEKKQ
jgi:hypothetical protein